MTGFDHVDQTELEDATNILLVAPEVGQPVESLFSELLLSLETPPDHLVGVAISKSPWDFLEPWRRAFPRAEASFSFVSTNGISRSVTADATGGPATGSDVTHVNDVTPIDAFGEAIADHLADAEPETALCFHSLTDLLEFVDEETAFDFLHAVLSRVRRTGARGVYHIDADVHDDETIVTLSTLFDLVVEVGGSGPTDGGSTGSGESL